MDRYILPTTKKYVINLVCVFIAKKKISAKRLFDKSSDDESVDIMELCDDDSDDNINDGSEVCLICEEYGKNEVWYRCTSCGFWVHADCSDADSPEGYICGICNRHIRKTEMNN